MKEFEMQRIQLNVCEKREGSSIDKKKFVVSCGRKSRTWVCMRKKCIKRKGRMMIYKKNSHNPVVILGNETEVGISILILCQKKLKRN